MKTRKLGCVGFIMVMCLLVSCNSSNADSTPEEAIETSDTVTKEIPLDRSGKPRSYYRNKPILEQYLGLSSLESGFDSLQIRIWLGYAFKDSSQLIVLSNSKGKWIGQVYSLVYEMNSKGDSITNIMKEVKLAEPKSGWKYLIEKLFILNILTLPDYHSIHGYYQGADGDAVVIEVSTKNRYRIYAYHEPNTVRTKFSQAENVEKILELLEREFQFRRIRNL